MIWSVKNERETPIGYVEANGKMFTAWLGHRLLGDYPTLDKARQAVRHVNRINEATP